MYQGLFDLADKLIIKSLNGFGSSDVIPIKNAHSKLLKK